MYIISHSYSYSIETTFVVFSLFNIILLLSVPPLHIHHQHLHDIGWLYLLLKTCALALSCIQVLSLPLSYVIQANEISYCVIGEEGCRVAWVLRIKRESLMR